MKYYIATGLSNATMHTLLHSELSDFCTLTYDWTHQGSVHHLGEKVMGEVAEAEIQGVLEADLLIVLLPGGRGIHAEVGAAIASGKPVFLFSENGEDFDASKGTCAIYFHPLVERFTRMADLMIRVAGLAGNQKLGESC